MDQNMAHSHTGCRKVAMSTRIYQNMDTEKIEYIPT